MGKRKLDKRSLMQWRSYWLWLNKIIIGKGGGLLAGVFFPHLLRTEIHYMSNSLEKSGFSKHLAGSIFMCYKKTL